MADVLLEYTEGSRKRGGAPGAGNTTDAPRRLTLDWSVDAMSPIVQLPLAPVYPSAREIMLYGKHGGMTTLVDEEDFAYLNQWRWWRYPNKGRDSQGYARRTARDEYGKMVTIFLHNAIMHPPPGLVVDHIQPHDTLDNRKANLRLVDRCSQARNQRMRKDNTSGYRGVSWAACVNRWHAQISDHGRVIHLGYFNTPEEASAAYEAGRISRGLLKATSDKMLALMRGEQH